MTKKEGKRFKKEPKKKKRIFLKIFLVLFFLCILIGVSSIGAVIYYTVKNSEPIDPAKIYETIDKTSYIYDNEGNLIDNLYYSEDRELVKIEEIPDIMKKSIIAIEDKTFYEHHGFNFKRMAGAVINKILGKSEAISGTSTITQQLARNVFLPTIKSERSIERKLTEMYYAYLIEQELSKDEILEAYLNTVYFGYGNYGIESAANTYFSKETKDLTLKESVILAALPQAPDTYAPLKNEESENTVKYEKGIYINKVAEDRRDTVLDLMLEQNIISKEEAEEAKQPFEDILDPNIKSSSSTFTYFNDYLIQQVQKDLIKTYDLTEEEAELMLYTGGLKIYSTVDPDIQDIILDEFEDDNNFPYNYGDKDTEGAMVITEVETGKIISMVGGRSGSGKKLFNRATSPRQPGSSIKPLSVYSAALQKSYEYAQNGELFRFTDFGIDKQGIKRYGNYITAGSTIIDERLTIDGRIWPQNVTKTYTGYKTFRTAIQQSVNTCAVKVLYQVGFDYSINMLKKYGISTLVTNGEYNDINPAALGLGAMTEGVTPLEMSLAYGTFPNGGITNSPVCYNKVENSSGEIILEGKATQTKTLDEGVAWIMTDVLKSVVSRGGGAPAKIYGVENGGKTGTTDNSDNIWFCGFTPKYSAALWIGTDQNDELSTMSYMAAALWGKIMNQVPDIEEGEYKEQPDNIIYQGGEYYTDGTQP